MSELKDNFVATVKESVTVQNYFQYILTVLNILNCIILINLLGIILINHFINILFTCPVLLSSYNKLPS